MIQKRNPDFMNYGGTEFRQLTNPAHAWADVIGMYSNIPAVRGFWPTSAQGGDGQLIDLISGNDGVRTNSTQHGSENLAQFIRYQGAQHHTITHNAQLSVLGTETFTRPAIRGMTVGLWVWFNAAAAAVEFAFSKAVTSGQRQWSIDRLNTGEIRARISTNGTTLVGPTSTDVVGSQEWKFVVLTYDPATQDATVWVDLETDTAATGVANIFAGTSNIAVGRNTAANQMNGRVSLLFLSGALLSDDQIVTLYNFSAPLFGKTA